MGLGDITYSCNVISPSDTEVSMRKRLKKKFRNGRPLYSLRGLRGKTKKAYNYFSSFLLLFCIIFFTVSCTSFRAGVEGLEKGEIVIERSGNMVSMMINGGI